MYRVPTRPGKMGVYLENLELSWNFLKFDKKILENDMKPGKIGQATNA